MVIIGADYHPGSQQIAFCNQDTGEYGEQRLNHSEGEAERFAHAKHLGAKCIFLARKRLKPDYGVNGHAPGP